jgi:predicted short-subunit dehydrogenase-like oxidoreductase (DUF2520 family)
MTPVVPTLNLLGAGRVGQTLAHLWHRRGLVQVQDVLTQSPESAQAACAFIGSGQPTATLAQMRSADLWMLAVPDTQIEGMAQALALQLQNTPATGRKEAAPILFHCSGLLPAQVLAPVAALGWRTASAHCILSFATPASAVAQFAGTPCALEGDSAACAQLATLLTGAGAQCFALASEHKLLYHAAAVFATNFVPVLQHVAEQAWQAAGVPETLLPGLRQTLMAKAVANVSAMGPLGALTGPAARQDLGAIERQSRAVNTWDTQAGAAYEALSALALRMAKTRTESPATPASTS